LIADEHVLWLPALWHRFKGEFEMYSFHRRHRPPPPTSLHKLLAIFCIPGGHSGYKYMLFLPESSMLGPVYEQILLAASPAVHDTLARLEAWELDLVALLAPCKT
jgi:hypothetical protein